jgi:ABC-2 type transport system ATP-binding protein
MIETENLTRKFGNLTAVENLTLHVAEGEVFGFLGPNGAGKSTTVRMLCCLIGKTSGKATIGGYSTDSEDNRLKIRKMVGLLPENVGLYDSLSAYKNLDFYGKLYEVPDERRKENIERLLRLLGIWERRDDAVGGFSKGTKQKIAIARSLIHEPQVLFLDEPTANLDPEAAKTVRDFVLDLKKEKRTIFLNTHNLGEAERLCDRIGILKNAVGCGGFPQESGTEPLQPQNHRSHGGGHPQVTEAVRTLSFVKNLRVSDNKLVLDMDSPERDNPELVRAVVAAGGNIQYVTELKSTLEDVYIKLFREAQTQ